jgi:hypothetical protein
MEQSETQLPALHTWPAPQLVPSRAFTFVHEPLAQAATWHVGGALHAVQLEGPHP